MATYIQLDQAAKEVGKSEITVRRLIKGAKISHRKEKTLTGFIYLVDPEEIQRYYSTGQPEHAIPLEEKELEEAPHSHDAEVTARQIRVAVTGESGNLSEYWQKRAETYEDRYYQELESQAKLREELGAWRGRAEQAQNMLVKLLPAPEQKAEVVPQAPQKEESSLPTWVLLLILGIGAVILVFAVYVAYVVFTR